MKFSNETKSWLKIICLPHLITMLLILPAAPLWLMAGTIGLYTSLPLSWNNAYTSMIYICLFIMMIALVAAYFCYTRYRQYCKILVSLAIYFWFLAGFFALAVNY